MSGMLLIALLWAAAPPDTSAVRMVSGEQILIQAKRHNAGTPGLRSVEEWLSNRAGLAVIKRANYAWDPVIRGQSADRVLIRIDGMNVLPACVDRMDPATSYVDTDNLERIDLSRGTFDGASAGRSGGALNLVTTRAVADLTEAHIETEYQSVSEQTSYRGMLNAGRGDVAFRVSGTYRHSGDYSAGGGERIPNSGFRKWNGKLDIGYRQARVSWIRDVARDIGYPGLIMDTGRAKADLFGLHVDHGASSFRLYHNRIDHYMHDYARDVTQRDVMPGMYMPMWGRTRTSGFSSESLWASNDRYLMLGTEVTYASAYSDMWMEPLDATVPEMWIINLGDVGMADAGVSLKHGITLWDQWDARFSTRMAMSHRSISHPDAIAVLRVYRPEMMERRWIPNGSASISIATDIGPRLMTELSASVSRRVPSHIELYGYYLYQPFDGFIYYGNPELKPESSLQMELALVSATNTLRTYVVAYDGYVAGVKQDEMFKEYRNIQGARQIGVEWESEMALSESVVWTHQASAVHGERIPLLPPFRYDTTIRVVRGAGMAEFNAVLTGRYQILGGMTQIPIGSLVKVTLAIDNALDSRVVEKLTPGQIPSPGRNVRVGVIGHW
jgi:iron complex outermembrane receptor protein